MPFRSRRQWRAAFAGKIPGIDKDKAREWAHETGSFSGLPDRAPAEKGKPHMRAKEARMTSKTLNKMLYLFDRLEDVDGNIAKNVLDLHQQEKKAAIGVLKIALSIPGPGEVRQITSNTVGKFRGIAGKTPEALRAPGPRSPGVLDPSRSIQNAMKAFR